MTDQKVLPNQEGYNFFHLFFFGKQNISTQKDVDIQSAERNVVMRLKQKQQIIIYYFKIIKKTLVITEVNNQNTQQSQLKLGTPHTV